MTELPERELYPRNPRILDEKLIAFNKARLAEDEELAQRNIGSGLHAGDPDRQYGPSYPDYQTYNDDDTDAADAFIVRFSPTRALREIEAKRRHLEDYRRAAWATQTAPADEAHSLRSYRDAAWGAVLADASVWADHPDYDQKWKLDS